MWSSLDVFERRYKVKMTFLGIDLHGKDYLK